MGLSDWKKRFLDMDVGVSKITIVEDVKRNFIQKGVSTPNKGGLDDRLVRILNVKTLGSEVADALKPKIKKFEQMTPLGYQQQLKQLIETLKGLKKNEKRNAISLLYQDAIRIIQAETVSAELLEEFRMMLLQG